MLAGSHAQVCIEFWLLCVLFLVTLQALVVDLSWQVVFDTVLLVLVDIVVVYSIVIVYSIVAVYSIVIVYSVLVVYYAQFNSVDVRYEV